MTGGKRAASPRSNGGEITAETRETDELSGFDVLERAIGDLEPGTILSIYRSEPRQARGFLEDLEVTAEELAGIRSYIKRNWGGGKFKCQWKRRDATGRTEFAPGCALFQVAGPPLYHGKRVLSDGTIEEPTPPATNPAPAPMVFAQPPPPSTSAPARDYNAELLGQLVPLVLNKADGSPLDVVQLVGALQSTIRQGADPDPFGQVEKTLGLLVKLRDTFGDGGAGEADEYDGDGGISDLLSGKGGGIEKILALKLLGPELGFGQQQQQYPPAPPGWQMTPQGWQQAPAPQAVPPPPPGWTYGPRGWERVTVDEEPPEPVGTGTPEVAPDRPAPTSDEPEDPGEYEPMTPEEIASEVLALTPEDQERVVLEIMGRMGVDRDQAASAFQQAAGSDVFPTPPIVVGGEKG